MGDFASKGVANAGLTTGIIGTVLGAAANSNNCNGGLLGGLFGGNRCGYGLAESQYVASILAENGMLKAENYSDRVAKEVYQQTLADNKQLRQDIRDELALREQITAGKIESLANVTTCNFNAVNTAIANLANTVSGITKCVIPTTAICPEVMPRYNSFVAPTADAPATQPVTGSVSVN